MESDPSRNGSHHSRHDDWRRASSSVWALPIVDSNRQPVWVTEVRGGHPFSGEAQIAGSDENPRALVELPVHTRAAG